MLREKPALFENGEARYLDDCRDGNELRIFCDDQGDVYVSVLPEGHKIGPTVRLCASGGAAEAAPGLLSAMRAAFAAIRDTAAPRALVDPKLRCFYFGCWDDAGHFLYAPGGRRASTRDVPELGKYASGALDGAFAPRRIAGRLCWSAQDPSGGLARRSDEYPQGEFLIHYLEIGFTAMAWWDRRQGDTRGGCNSVILLEGKHTADAMRAALLQHFPSVLANLERAGVRLVEVPRGC